MFSILFLCYACHRNGKHTPAHIYTRDTGVTRKHTSTGVGGTKADVPGRQVASSSAGLGRAQRKGDAVYPEKSRVRGHGVEKELVEEIFRRQQKHPLRLTGCGDGGGGSLAGTFSGFDLRGWRDNDSVKRCAFEEFSGR